MREMSYKRPPWKVAVAHTEVVLHNEQKYWSIKWG